MNGFVSHMPSQGRDPHDNKTMELDLGAPVVDERIAAFMVKSREGDWTLASLLAFALGYEYLSWLYLMEREVQA